LEAFTELYDSLTFKYIHFERLKSYKYMQLKGHLYKVISHYNYPYLDIIVRMVLFFRNLSTLNFSKKSISSVIRTY